MGKISQCSATAGCQRGFIVRSGYCQLIRGFESFITEKLTIYTVYIVIFCYLNFQIVNFMVLLSYFVVALLYALLSD